ncbi:beta strand repeat-containing protein [uncultured Sphingomonas sp.]|uniref:beta strand repeat-containing protein n=1 Tax=uncultured Sphingomonas sp. TaxID=158754 RepID=UPI0035CB748E
MATIEGTGASEALQGGNEADFIRGFGGNDTINGGNGNDTMQGDDGDDTYVVGQIGDVVNESADQGSDTVFVDVPSFNGSFGGTATVAGGTYANVEAIAARDGSGTDAFNLTGGTQTRTLAGNNGVNTFTSGAGTQAQTLVGLGGNDVYNINRANQTVQEAADGGTDRVNVTFAAGFEAFSLAAGSSIETVGLLGTPGSFTGNALAQTVIGSTGADTIDGAGGADQINAGDGDDVVAVQSGARVAGGAGNDRVISSTSYALTSGTATGGVADLANVESLELAGRTTTPGVSILTASTATTNNSFLVGDAGGQLIIGDNGANTILGAASTTAGIDTLVGLGGTDTYRVYNTTDTVVEGSSVAGSAGDTGGFDTIFTSVSYDLAANDTRVAAAFAAGVADDPATPANEAVAAGSLNGVFTDVATVQQIEVLSTAENAGVEAINLTGNSFAQNIVGNNGVNILNGGGGSDNLIGLGGNDTYLISNANITVQEAQNGGTDDVQVTFQAPGAGAFTRFVLSAGAGVESISVVGANVGTLVGNELNQVIVGAAGNDSLIGGGGADTLRGATGNDTYTVDSLTDITNDLVGEGTDTVLFTGTTGGYALSSGTTTGTNSNIAEIEVLRAGPYAAQNANGDFVALSARATQTDAIYLVGNQFAQLITGNNGANTILGSAAANGDVVGGVAVADTLAGLSGDDTYRVFSTSDIVLEGTDGGNDIVFTNNSFSLLQNANAAFNFAATLPGGRPTDTGTATNGNIEVLSAADQGSTVAVTLLGDNGNNTVIGSNGVNVIGGGAGNDTLIGFGRGDRFYFDNAGNANADVIRDFSSATGDSLLLLSSQFQGGVLDANNDGFLDGNRFVNLSQSVPAGNSAIIAYDPATGQVTFYADGLNTPGTALAIANIGAGNDLASSDILIAAGTPQF